MTTKAFNIDKLHLGEGAHTDRSNGLCVMEAVAWYNNEPHSDHPECTSPVLAANVRILNDAMPGDATRDKYLKPFIIPLVGTKATLEVEVKRAEHFARAAVTKFAPLALRAAGMTKEAERLEALSPDTPLAELEDAAGDAARDAAGYAARDAGYAAALWSTATDVLREAIAIQAATWGQ